MNSSKSWQKEYEVGLPEIDSQHEGLFDLSDRIDELESDQLTTCAMELYKYTRRHFKAEEKFLEEINYPFLEEHRELHEELISHLNEITETGFKTREAVSEFKTFYNEWLAKHIVQEDVNYVKFFCTKDTE